MVGSAYVILYLSLMVDLIVVIIMDTSVVKMTANLCFHILDESIQ